MDFDINEKLDKLEEKAVQEFRFAQKGHFDGMKGQSHAKQTIRQEIIERFSDLQEDTVV